MGIPQTAAAPALTVKAAKEIVGGLSSPSKMPCHGYSIPASSCITGSKLRKVKGSTCAKCYAFKGNYGWRTVQAALQRRETALSDPRWVDAMAFLINRYEAGDGKSGVFRWHDSGDLQSVDHLAQIVRVCELTPTVKHWLPSREYAIVRKYLATVGEFPANLTVRLSAHMVNQYKLPTIPGVVWSTVGDDPQHYDCPAVANKTGVCGNCRACWSPRVAVVNYRPH